MKKVTELTKANEIKNEDILMIVQKISSCKEVDRVLVIDDGTIVGNGTHAELIENNERR